jgi:HD-GYP domain-containing protein (c-di-GMP phosphodiesterase class II)
VGDIGRACGKTSRYRQSRDSGHHEFWNGQGYLDGLAGQNIPLAARMVAVADSFSAITTDRPYRAARSQGMALEELRRCTGTHCDPTVVKAMELILLREAAAPPLAA